LPFSIDFDRALTTLALPCECVIPRQFYKVTHTRKRFTALFRDHACEPVPEKNFWALWCNCKGKLTEANTPTIRLGATPCGLTSAHLHHPPFFTGRMPFLPPDQQCQSTEGTVTKVNSHSGYCPVAMQQSYWLIPRFLGYFLARIGPTKLTRK